MLPLSEIHKVVRSVDRTVRSPVADTVSAAWGCAPGAARYRRSSASHVFAIVDDETDDGAAPFGYLRFVPAAHRRLARVTAVADLVHRLSEAGLPVAAVIRSTAGGLVETVTTGLGEMHAMLVRPADGVQVDVDELSPSRALAWGAALARLHHGGTGTGTGTGIGIGVGVGLPTGFADLDHSAPAFTGDPPLAAAVRRLTDRLGELPRDPARFGVVHGDFELDNLAWRGDVPTAYDFDEAAHSWFVADIAYAVRELGPVPAGTPACDDVPLFAAFLAGYRRFGPLDDDDLAHLPLFAALHAATAMVRLSPVLDAGTSATDPEWLVRLRRRLDEHLGRQRAAILQWRA